MLTPAAVQQLVETGFVVVEGLVPGSELVALAAAYDVAMAMADPVDVSVGSTTTRVSDLVNASPSFDALYLFEPVLEACRRVIKRPFKLSTLHGRTLHPRTPAQGLHVDFARKPDGWPMVGFIIMIDEFRNENGATRFVPASHLWPDVPAGLSADHERQVPACGPAGSVVIFNGSVWHGHGPNLTDKGRRSIQGAYIRREEKGWLDPSRMQPHTLARISPLARHLLAV